jgi:hypothetical protein
MVVIRDDQGLPQRGPGLEKPRMSSRVSALCAAVVGCALFANDVWAAAGRTSCAVAIPHGDIDRIDGSVKNANGNFIDGSLSTLTYGGWRYWLAAVHASTGEITHVKYQGDFSRPLATKVWQKTGLQLFTSGTLSIDAGYTTTAWIVNAYQDTDGILAFVHLEAYNSSDSSLWKGRVGLAWSTNSGDSFAYLGHIIGPQSEPASEPVANVQGVPYFVKDGYLYAIYKDGASPAIARASLSAVLSAAKNGTSLPEWNKYFNGGWTSAGIGGQAAALDLPGILHGDAGFYASNGLVYAVTTLPRGFGDYTWTKLYTSSNLINWQEEATLQSETADSHSGYQYATIVPTSGDDNGSVGSQFYVYVVKDYASNLRHQGYRWLVNVDGPDSNACTIDAGWLVDVSNYKKYYSNGAQYCLMTQVHDSVVASNPFVLRTTVWPALTTMSNGGNCRPKAPATVAAGFFKDLGDEQYEYYSNGAGHYCRFALAGSASYPSYSGVPYDMMFDGDCDPAAPDTQPAGFFSTPWGTFYSNGVNAFCKYSDPTGSAKIPKSMQDNGSCN